LPEIKPIILKCDDVYLYTSYLKRIVDITMVQELLSMMVLSESLEKDLGIAKMLYELGIYNTKPRKDKNFDNNLKI
jgi:hypothetical protein